MPNGVTSAASSDSAPNNSQVPAARRRDRQSGAAISASTANSAANAKPKMKLPCRLAHRTISGTSHKGGARSSSRAFTSAAVHSTRIGSAKICGRARMWPEIRCQASAVASNAWIGARLRSNRRSSSAKVAAADNAAAAARPAQPK